MTVLKNRLESLDRDDKDYDSSIFDIKENIAQLFDKYKDFDFPDGGKYKLYELRAEYYFVKGNKPLAEKNIKKAISVREEEKDQPLFPWGRA